MADEEDMEVAKKKPRKSKSSKKTVTTRPNNNLPIKPLKEGVPANNPSRGPEKVQKSDFGFRNLEVKHMGPHHTSNINDQSFLHFVLHSNKKEWVRVNVESFSLTLYGTYTPEDAHIIAGGTPEERSTTRALRARNARPQIYLDPSVMGIGFFNRCDVTLNGVPVPTNGWISGYFNQLARVCHICNADSSKVYIALANDIDFTKTGDAMSQLMKNATEAFEYDAFNSQEGVRIPIPLNGIFPFDCFNKSIESMDKTKEEGYWMPPDTVLDVKLHLNKNVIDSIFHHHVDLSNTYWTLSTPPIPDPVDRTIKLTFQDVIMDYESGEMRPADHDKTLAKYKGHNVAMYTYDIVRGQYQALNSEASSTQNEFMIPPYCRLVYILCVPDWACFLMEQQKKPLSGLSRFPENSTSITIGFGGEEYLVTREFKYFGTNTRRNEKSKHIWYKYLTKQRLWKGSFDQIFPRGNKISVCQFFAFNLKNYMSDKSETLKINCLFSGETSPKNRQFICLSVHPNGRALCKSGPGELNWQWEFLQGT